MIAYLVSAHHHPNLLTQLTRRLTTEQSACFVHIDRKMDLRPFSSLRGRGVSVLDDRVPVYWGGWSQVAATLKLIDAALKDPRPFRHFALISGVDYPLARPEVMLRYLDALNMECINCLPAPAPIAQKPWSRFSVRKLEGSDRQSTIRAKLIRATNKALAKLPERDVIRQLDGLRPHVGSNWWILSREAVSRALEIYHKGGGPIRLFERSHCPDESYFQTIVGSSMPVSRIGRAFTYTDWSGPNPPAEISDSHVDLLTNSWFHFDDFYGRAPCLFVRKFPAGREDLRERIDAFANERVLDPIRDVVTGRLGSSEFEYVPLPEWAVA